MSVNSDLSLVNSDLSLMNSDLSQLSVGRVFCLSVPSVYLSINLSVPSVYLSINLYPRSYHNLAEIGRASCRERV